MDDHNSRPSIDSHSLWEIRALEDYVEREEQRQRLLSQQHASWFEHVRQRQRLLRARRALQWASARTDGESHYIWHHGILRYGAAIFISVVVTILMAGGIPHIPEVVATILTGATLGVLGGYFAGLVTWDEAEARFFRTIATLPHSQPIDLPPFT